MLIFLQQCVLFDTEGVIFKAVGILYNSKFLWLPLVLETKHFSTECLHCTSLCFLLFQACISWVFF